MPPAFFGPTGSEHAHADRFISRLKVEANLQTSPQPLRFARQGVGTQYRANSGLLDLCSPGKILLLPTAYPASRRASVTLIPASALPNAGPGGDRR